jgi:hypothetical protein
MRIPAGLIRWGYRLGCALGAGLVLAGLAFAIGYLLRDYPSLRDAYLSDGPFYRDGQWATDFFTPEVKGWGNLFCALGMAGGSVLLVHLLARWRAAERGMQADLVIQVTRGEGWYLLALWAVQLVLWLYGTSRVPPAYDEAFSALHIAGQGPFRALSYYMLPNNHVLFNVLNALVFGWAGDLVRTGRFISLLAWWGVATVLYAWARKVAGKLGGGALVPAVLVSLPVWGFAIQGRGYLLLVWFAWLAFVGAWEFVAGRGRGWLTLFSVSCVLGYATVPVFLYTHLALLAWMVYERRRIGWDLVRSQLLAGMGILLFYLPLLGYSGLGSLVGNRYISAGGRGFGEFAISFLPTVPGYAGWIGPGAAVLLLAPLLGLVIPVRPAYRRFLRFYLMLLTSTLLVVLLMRAVPFHRALVVQYSVAMVAAGLLVVRNHLRWVWVGLALLFVFTVPRRFSLHLYYYDIVPTHRSAAALVNGIPDGATVFATDEAFYPAYLWRQRGGELTDGTDRATHYLRGPGGPAPPGEFTSVTAAVGVELYAR